MMLGFFNVLFCIKNTAGNDGFGIGKVFFQIHPFFLTIFEVMHTGSETLFEPQGKRFGF
jgi:hypothetical protein